MIGVFDSGLGGLSVLAEIARLLPRADLVYIADSAHVPYGPRPDSFLRARVMAIGHRLAAMGCRLVVVACNTATAAAIHDLRTAHPGLGVVGVEPGIKPAARSTRSGRIAVLATESTARSERLARLVARHAGNVTVRIVPCPDWATRVETLRHHEPEFVAGVQETVRPLVADGIDRIVLGCTHYSFLAPTIALAAAGQAELVDVATPVAEQARRLAGEAAGTEGRLQLYATARPERLMAALPALGLPVLAARARAAQTIDC